MNSDLEEEMKQVKKILMSFEEYAKNATPEVLTLLIHSVVEKIYVTTENGVDSIAFCCISTGVFGFLQREAAEIAISTVKRHKKTTKSDIKVIFNVFKDDDLMIYRNLLDR